MEAPELLTGSRDIDDDPFANEQLQGELVRTSFWIEEEDKAQLESLVAIYKRHSRKKKISISDVLRMAVKSFIEKQKILKSQNVGIYKIKKNAKVIGFL